MAHCDVFIFLRHTNTLTCLLIYLLTYSIYLLCYKHQVVLVNLEMTGKMVVHLMCQIDSESVLFMEHSVYCIASQ